MTAETLIQTQVAHPVESGSVSIAVNSPRWLKSLLHPALRPVVLGVLLFALLNLMLTLGITFSPLNAKFNFKYGNFLPVKLAMLQDHQPDKLDVLFMGTSQTNNGFITSVFEQTAARGLNSFNLGLPNNRYDIMLAALRMQIHRYGKPRLLLVELSPSIQEKNSYFYYLPALYYRTLLEKDPALAPQALGNPLLAENVKTELFYSSLSSLRQFRHTFSPLNVVNKVSGKLASVSSRLSGAEVAVASDDESASAPVDPFAMPLARERRQLPEMELRPEMTEKGWYAKTQSPYMTTPTGIQLSVREARQYYIDHQDEVNFEKLGALLAFCRQQDVPVVLVSWPNHPAFLQEFRQSKLAEKYQRGLQELLAKEPTPVIDLNQDIPAWQRADDGGLFADPRHLTPQGAQLFSGILAHRLMALPQVASLFPSKARIAQVRVPH